MLEALYKDRRWNSLDDQRSRNWRRVHPLPGAVKDLQCLNVILLIQNREDFIAGLISVDFEIQISGSYSVCAPIPITRSSTGPVWGG